MSGLPERGQHGLPSAGEFGACGARIVDLECQISGPLAAAEAGRAGRSRQVLRGCDTFHSARFGSKMWRYAHDDRNLGGCCRVVVKAGQTVCWGPQEWGGQTAVLEKL